MGDDGIFYGRLVHFTVSCYILWAFGIVRGNLVYFSRFGILYQEKSGKPGLCLRGQIQMMYRHVCITRHHVGNRVSR
jgi:hypothetical protein